MADLDLTSDYSPDSIRQKGWPTSTIIRPTPTGMPTREEALLLKKTQQTAKQAAREVALREREQLAKQENERLFGFYPNPYYAGPQVGIFIGTIWVADAIGISYTETISKSPLFGYASTHFDAVAKGNTLVQGQLTIAYTSPSYLARILDKYSSQEGRQSMFPTKIADPIERAKKLFWDHETLDTPVSTVPLEYGYDRGTSGHIRKGFDIRVFYGAQEFIRDQTQAQNIGTRVTGPIEVIQQVHLTGRPIEIGPTGEPIAETYTFFARSVTTGAPIRASVPVVSEEVSFNQRFSANLSGR